MLTIFRIWLPVIATVPRRDHLDDMTYLIRSLVFAGLFLAFASRPAYTQDQPDSTGVGQLSTQEAEAAISASPAAETQFQGLPRRAPEPRTLHEFWLVFAGLSAAWAGIVLYILKFGAPLRRITDMMRRAEQGGGV